MLFQQVYCAFEEIPEGFSRHQLTQVREHSSIKIVPRRFKSASTRIEVEFAVLGRELVAASLQFTMVRTVFAACAAHGLDGRDEKPPHVAHTRRKLNGTSWLVFTVWWTRRKKLTAPTDQFFKASADVFG